MHAARQRARVHLHFCTQWFRGQMAAGRYLLYEHPQTAASWAEPCVANIARDDRVFRTEIDQCAYGLTSEDSEGVAPARKPTSMLTNSVGLKNALCKKCQGCSRHVQLVEGRARAAQVYPRGLCRAVMQGISSYEQGRNEIMGQQNQVQAHLSRLRRAVPENDL